MELYNWYTFEDEYHTYGYTLFCPLKRLDNNHFSYYGIILYPNFFKDTIYFGNMKKKLENSAVEYNSRVYPQDCIVKIFESEVKFEDIE